MKRIVSICTVFFFVFSFLASPKQALAARSNAGGGELAEFDFGDIALGIGMEIGGVIIGGALKSAIGSGFSSLIYGASDSGGIFSTMENAFIGGLSKPFVNSFQSFLPYVASAVNDYNVSMQVSRAVYMAGKYHGWSPSTSFLVSGVLGSVAQGFVNPDINVELDLPYVGAMTTDLNAFNFSNTLKSVAIGGLQGLARSGIIVAIDGAKIDRGGQPGTVSEILGMLASTTAGNFAKDFANGGVSEWSLDKNPISTTINMWPRLVARAASIAVVDSLDPKTKTWLGRFLRPVVEGAVEGTVGGIAYSQGYKVSLPDLPNIPGLSPSTNQSYNYYLQGSIPNYNLGNVTINSRGGYSSDQFYRKWLKQVDFNK